MTASKWISAIVLGLLLFVLVPKSAQARLDPSGEKTEPVQQQPAPAKITPRYDPAQFRATWGISPDVLINCDPQGNILENLSPNRVETFHKLQSGACLAQASAEQVQNSGGGINSAAGGKKAGYNGVSGESNMLKINPAFTETRYVYLQCGKKVATFGPPSCSCGGNMRYTTDCSHIKTVYISIPCR